MRDFLTDILGSYSPVTYTDSNGIDIVASGLAGLDWEYIFTGVLFCITVWCVLKILGGIICQIS